MKVFDLSSYLLGDALPAGAMTQPYLAERRTLQGTEPVVVKELLLMFALKGDTRTRWLNCAARAAAFSHPSSIPILDFGPSGDTAYLVVEHVAGASLATILRALRKTKERLSVDAAVHFTRVLLDVLKHAHAATPPLLHGDVSAEVIRIQLNGVVRVSDGATWGALLPADAVRVRFERGRVVYQSPEQINALATDTRSELFSAGVLLHEMLAGRRPFQGATQLAVAMAIAGGNRTSLREAAPEAPAQLHDIVDGLLAAKPQERFQSADAVLAALSAWPVADVRAELAALAARFQALEAPAKPAPIAPPAPSAPPASTPPIAPLAQRADEPRTMMGFAPFAKPTSPPPAPEASERGEPRTRMGHGMVAALERARAEHSGSQEPAGSSGEARTRVHALLEPPVRQGSAVPPAVTTPSPPIAAATSHEPTPRPVAVPPATVPAPPRVAVPDPLLPEPPSATIFGGAASSHPPPPKVSPSPAPPPPVAASPAALGSSRVAPPPMMPPLVTAPAGSPSGRPAPPPLVGPVAAPAAPPAAPTWAALAHSPSGALDEPTPTTAAPASASAPPMVSDGKTSVIDAATVRALGSARPAQPARPAEPAPVVTPPPVIAPHSPPAFDSAPVFPSAPSYSSYAGPPLDPTPSMSPPRSDRGWKDPSQTLFRAKQYAQDPTRRERARVPMPVVVTLAVVFGFALVAGGYFILRLFQ